MVKGKLLELKNYLEEMQSTSGRGTHTEWQIERALKLVDSTIAEVERYKIEDIPDPDEMVELQIDNSTQTIAEAWEKSKQRKQQIKNTKQ